MKTFALIVAAALFFAGLPILTSMIVFGVVMHTIDARRLARLRAEVARKHAAGTLAAEIDAHWAAVDARRAARHAR